MILISILIFVLLHLIKMKLLLVEDEPNLLSILRKGFSENNNGGGYAPMMSARADAAMVEKAAAVQLPAGQQKVTVDVTLNYLLK